MQDQRRRIVTAVHVAVEINQLAWLEPSGVWSNSGDTVDGR